MLFLTGILTALECGVDMFGALGPIQEILIDNSDLPFASRAALYENLLERLPNQYINMFVAHAADTGLLVSYYSHASIETSVD